MYVYEPYKGAHRPIHYIVSHINVYRCSVDALRYSCVYDIGDGIPILSNKFCFRFAIFLHNFSEKYARNLFSTSFIPCLSISLSSSFSSFSLFVCPFLSFRVVLLASCVLVLGAFAFWHVIQFVYFWLHSFYSISIANTKFSPFSFPCSFLFSSLISFVCSCSVFTLCDFVYLRVSCCALLIIVLLFPKKGNKKIIFSLLHFSTFVSSAHTFAENYNNNKKRTNK